MSTAMNTILKSQEKQSLKPPQDPERRTDLSTDHENPLTSSRSKTSHAVGGNYSYWGRRAFERHFQVCHSGGNGHEKQPEKRGERMDKFGL